MTSSSPVLAKKIGCSPNHMPASEPAEVVVTVRALPEKDEVAVLKGQKTEEAALVEQVLEVLRQQRNQRAPPQP